MISEEQQEEFKAKFGDELVYHESEKLGVFLFKRPSALIYSKFETMSQRRNANPLQCARQMVIDCFCFPIGADEKPDYQKLDLLFQERPALPTNLFSELYELAGGNDTLSGKL